MLPAGRESEDEVEQDEEPELADRGRGSRDRPGGGSRFAASRTPNNPKIAPDAPTAGTSPPNTKLATDPGRGAEPGTGPGTTASRTSARRWVPSRYSAYMLKKQVRAGRQWTSVTVHSRQYSPAATAALSSQSAWSRSAPSEVNSTTSETIAVAAMTMVETGISGPSPRPRAKYRPGRAGVARLLRQPPEPGGDLRLVRLRAPVGRLRDRPAARHAGRQLGRRAREVPPGRIGRWRLPDWMAASQVATAPILVVQPVARLARARAARRP